MTPPHTSCKTLDTTPLDSPADYAPFCRKRREKLCRRIADVEQMDALMVTNMANIRYLSGFSGSSAILLITGDNAWLLTDSRYTEQAEHESPGLMVVEYREPLDCVMETALREGISELGFEAGDVTVARAGEMDEKLKSVTLVPTRNIVEDLRIIKDSAEISAMRALNAMLEKTIHLAGKLIKPGAVERSIAMELELELRKDGAQGAAFDFIVASGPRGALPHGIASHKTIQAGELITLDWGAKRWGYHSDNTRMFAVGAIDDELEEIYKITLSANIAAISAVKPGATLKEIDSAARDLISGAGYADRFGHGTGHGVGLDIHEKPAVSWRSEAAVAPGMVFTIEPGIYLPGKGGVRIEDMVLVTDSGHEVLSAGISKDLIHL